MDDFQKSERGRGRERVRGSGAVVVDHVATGCAVVSGEWCVVQNFRHEDARMAWK